MKRMIYLALALLLVLSGCGMEQETYTLELVTKSDKEVADFWSRVYEGAQAAADIYGVNLEYYAPQSEEAIQEQIAILADAQSRRPDAMILAASDYNLLAEPVENLIDEDIPVIMVDSNVDSDRTVAYIGTDNEAIGQLLAEKLHENVETPGKIAIVSFVKDSYTAVSREKGFRQEMEQQAGFTMLDTAYGYSNVELSTQLTVELVENNPDLVAIAALNEQSIEGVCLAMEQFPDRQIQVFAIDCTPTQVPYMEDGTIDFSVIQNPYQMGYYSVETAYKYLEGEKKQDNVYTDIYPVDVSMVFDDIYQQLIFPFE